MINYLKAKFVSFVAGSAVMLILAMVSVCLALFVCSCDREGNCDSAKAKHVILISIDTCRADHLSCYGYGHETTPGIDSIAKKSAVFENTISTAPFTLPAHTSMLCGTVPAYHGVHDNFRYQVDTSNLTVAEVMQQHGYRTVAIVSSFVMDSQFGLDQGFDTYHDQFVQGDKSGSVNERCGEEVTQLANQWLDQRGKDPFFLFLH